MPAAVPLTDATTGFWQSSTAATRRWAPSASTRITVPGGGSPASSSAVSIWGCGALRSAPVQKCFPVEAMTTVRTCGSRSASWIRSIIALRWSGVRALPESGRFSVIQTMPSAKRRSKVPSMRLSDSLTT
jgi:hypothetical protein